MSPGATNLNWDTDVIKHYVRHQAWLPAAIEQVAQTRCQGRTPRYFTFCASKAIDVFMFLKEGVLHRDPESDVVVDTYFCEHDNAQFNEISQLIGAHEQGFLGSFQDMILFEDDDQTRGRRYGDETERHPASLRSRLRTKDRHQRFRDAGPFDLINLDICGTFFPPAGGVQSPMLRSIKTLLDWQTEFAIADDRFQSFTVFLTAHVESGRVNESALQELVNMIEGNQAAYSGFSDAIDKRFGTSDARQISLEDFTGFYCVGLPKVIVGSAFDKGWRAEATYSGLYRRQRQPVNGDPPTSYDMLAWVGKFERNLSHQLPLGRPQTPDDQAYAELIKRLTCPPVNIDCAAEAIKAEVENNLNDVVAFREAYQCHIRSRI